MVSCKIDSEASTDCIAEKVASGDPYACFDRDGAFMSGLNEARACACGAKDEASYAACFADLPAYGNHGAAARATAT